MRRGGHDAGHGLVVVAAHVREGQPLAVQVGVELLDADAGLGADQAPPAPFGPQEVGLAGRHPAEPVGLEQEPGRERDVGPRVTRSDRADGRAGVPRLADDRRDLLDRLGLVDPQGIDGLVAQVVLPRRTDVER